MGIDAVMYAKTKETVTPDDILDWSRRLCAAFGHEHFMLNHPRNPSPFSGIRHALSIVPEREEDWRDVGREPGETVIEVHWYTRFYGPHYERGNFMLIYCVGQWLETTIPGASVFYGGDCADVMAPFGPTERAELWQHFCSRHNRDYFNSSFGISGQFPPPIRNCEHCKIPLDGYGSGREYSAMRCKCCGFQLHTHDAGTTWMYRLGESKEEKLFVLLPGDISQEKSES